MQQSVNGQANSSRQQAARRINQVQISGFWLAEIAAEAHQAWFDQRGLAVEIHDQLAEGDRVTTRKTIHATHRGELFGVPATNRRVAIEVIDIVRLEQSRYLEHWG